MKLQSRLLGTGRAQGRRSGSDTSGATNTQRVPGAPTTGIRSLAADPKTIQFSYPENWVLVARTAAALMVMLCIANAGLFFIPVIFAPGHSILSLFSWTTLGFALSIAGAGLVAGFLANLFPTVRVTQEGFGIAEVNGWRIIPWKQISVLHVMELHNTGRYVLLVPFTGETKPSRPAPSLALIPPLMGASGWGGHGVMLTSDMKDFERLVKLIMSHMVVASGQNPNSTPLDAYMDEGALMPIAQLFLDPEAEIVRVASSPVASSALYGVKDEETEPPIAWPVVLKRQFLVALVPVFVLVSDVLMHNYERPFMFVHVIWALILFGLGVLELPFVAALTRAVGELMVGHGLFNRTVWAYLELQVPRVFLIAAGGSLLALGLPAFFTEALWLAGIAVTTFLTVRYVMRVYYMPITHTLLAGLGTFIFQFMLFALYMGVR